MNESGSIKDKNLSSKNVTNVVELSAKEMSNEERNEMFGSEICQRKLTRGECDYLQSALGSSKMTGSGNEKK